MANLTLPSNEISTTNVVGSSSSSSRRLNRSKSERYSKVPADVKESFLRVLKATADPNLWKVMADELGIKKSDIEWIEKSVLENRSDSSFSPYVELIKAYEDYDQSVKTLFIKLGL